MKKLYKKKLTPILIGLTILLTTDGASTYKTVNPSSFHYASEQIVNDTLRASYLYNIQKLTRNKRYARKEKKWVAVKIKNISSSTVSLDRDKFKIYLDKGEKYEYPISAYTKRVKQRVSLHLLHTLWGP